MRKIPAGILAPAALLAAAVRVLRRVLRYGGWLFPAVLCLLAVVPPLAATPIRKWIQRAGLEEDRSGPLFRPTLTPRGNGTDGFRRKHMTTRAIQKLVKKYAARIGAESEGACRSSACYDVCALRSSASSSFCRK